MNAFRPIRGRSDCGSSGTSYLFLEIGEFGFANDGLGARTSDTSLNVPQCWHS